MGQADGRARLRTFRRARRRYRHLRHQPPGPGLSGPADRRPTRTRANSSVAAQPPDGPHGVARMPWTYVEAAGRYCSRTWSMRCPGEGGVSPGAGARPVGRGRGSGGRRAREQVRHVGEGRGGRPRRCGGVEGGLQDGDVSAEAVGDGVEVPGRPGRPIVATWMRQSGGASARTSASCGVRSRVAMSTPCCMTPYPIGPVDLRHLVEQGVERVRPRRGRLGGVPAQLADGPGERAGQPVAQLATVPGRGELTLVAHA